MLEKRKPINTAPDAKTFPLNKNLLTWVSRLTTLFCYTSALTINALFLFAVVTRNNNKTFHGNHSAHVVPVSTKLYL